MKETSLPRRMPIADRPRHSSAANYLLAPAVLMVLGLFTAGPASADQLSIEVRRGWNLLSLPVTAPDGTTGSLFPTAASAAYVFQEAAGYSAQDLLWHGTGFWLKFDSAQSVPISGGLILGDSIGVQAGWHLIGPLSLPVAVDSVRTTPPGIITGSFIGYTPGVGYEQTDTLRPGVGYWVKVGQSGTLILESSDGLPCPGQPTVSHAGMTYHTVQIGNQCWLRENINVGTMISGTVDPANNGIIEKYCYDDDTARCSTYGGLYQWDEAMQYEAVWGGQGICPPGWHIPGRSDFQTLIARVAADGNALKALGQGIGPGAGTNTSGFSALLAGYRFSFGYFVQLGLNTDLWSSDRLSGTNAHFLALHHDEGVIDMSYFDTHNGFSIRCLRNDTLQIPNQPPRAPSDPSPDSAATNVPVAPTLFWSCSDPDGDLLSYTVLLGVLSPPDSVITAHQSEPSLAMNGLQGGTTYYWRVVATDDHGNATSGPVWEFTTTAMGLPCPGTVTVSYLGRVYTTVQIGNQCWLRENLDVGTIVVDSLDQADNAILEKYCYDNDTANCNTYGGLYQWDEAMQYVATQGAQGICPPDWHIPTVGELRMLDTLVQGDGNALKMVGQGSGGGAGTNISGFSALLAGYRYDWSGSGFDGLGSNTFIWGSQEEDSTYARGLYLNATTGLLDVGMDYQWYGFSVRCLKNQTD